jgi:hypothetical protein
VVCESHLGTHSQQYVDASSQRPSASRSTARRPSLARKWSSRPRGQRRPFRVTGRGRVSRARSRLCRKTPRMLASARQFKNVPGLVPAKSRNLAITGNTPCQFAGLLDKPPLPTRTFDPSLTIDDETERAGEAGKPRARPKTSDHACPPMPGVVFPQCSLDRARPVLPRFDEWLGTRRRISTRGAFA